jgi:SulP family sulfate permease
MNPSGLLGAAGRWLASVKPSRRTLKEDVVAGLPGAISSVPDGMASSVLAGVNPVFGLYASGFGPIAGGLTSHTRLMVITTTSAAALAAGSTLAGIDEADRTDALFLLTVIAGAVMIAAGLFRLGRYTRFVAHSVMIGFLTGVAVNIILGQIPDLLGVRAEGSTNVQKAFDALTMIGDADLATLLIGLAALAIVIVVDRTPMRLVSAVVALLIPTLAMIVFGLDSVARVEDVGDIPRGLPAPQIPDFGLISLEIIVGAVALAIIVLVQGAGVAQSAPNAGGGRPNANQDFVAHGVANIAAGAFRGIPVGGSVGQTALNVTAGARTRWAAIYSGVWMLVILLFFSRLVGEVAMPTLAAVLVYAAFSSLRFNQVSTILRVNRNAQIALITTFVATLVLPVAAAVGVGVALSLLLQLNREALDLEVVERIHHPDGHVEERPVRQRLQSDTVVEIDVYGSLFYAGAQTLRAKLPDPTGVERPVVVLRLRGRSSLGATFVSVIDEYAHRLHQAGGRLYLSGVDPGVMAMLERTNQINGISHVRAFAATPTVGEATMEATEAANSWLITRRPNEE